MVLKERQGSTLRSFGFVGEGRNDLELGMKSLKIAGEGSNAYLVDSICIGTDSDVRAFFRAGGGVETGSPVDSIDRLEDPCEAR